MGTLTKQIYRYTHKRNMRHNENLWPYVKIRRNETGEITDLSYKSQNMRLTSLSSLQNAYSDSVLLTATGPSVNELDFSQRPANVRAAGVNGAWHLHRQLNFNFYFIVDMTFIDHHESIIKEICSAQDVLLFTTVMGVIKLIEMNGLENIHCKITVIEDACYQTYCPSVRADEITAFFTAETSFALSTHNPKIAFSKDIRKGVFDAGTVVYWALQVLGFMGFTTIYIAGLDLNNLNEPRFYENRASMRPSFLHNKLNTIVLPALKLAQQTLSMKGVNIINLSPHSAVPESTFPKKGF